MFMSLDEAIQNSIDACTSNDEYELGRSIDAGVDINYRHTWITSNDIPVDWTLLYLATVMRHPKMVRYLLEKGADVSVGSSWNGTIPMEYVILDMLHGDEDDAGRVVDCLEIASMLIDVSDVNEKLPGMRELPLEAALGSPGIVQLLIRAGCNIHVKSETGLTMLMLAAFDGNITTMRLLIEAGVDIEERDDNPRRNFNMRSIYRLLVNQICNGNTHHGWTALDYARASEDSAAIDVIETELLRRNRQETFAMIGIPRLAEASPQAPLNDDMIREILEHLQEAKVHVPNLTHVNVEEIDTDGSDSDDYSIESDSGSDIDPVDL